MKSFAKPIGIILVMLAVIGYTVFNFVNGKIDTPMFLVSMAILCLPLINMVNLLIQEWKKK